MDGAREIYSWNQRLGMELSQLNTLGLRSHGFRVHQATPNSGRGKTAQLLCYG